MNEIPRRIDLRRNSVGEKAIRDAVDAVEAMGADERLTDAVVLLQAARESVADYVDGVQGHRRRVVGCQDESSPSVQTKDETR